MRQIIYYVATSIDGYISGFDDDISGFVATGNGIDKYLKDLQDFDTVIMGRKTYESGYQFGLKAGQLAYPHMRHYIFSSSLHFENADEKVKVCPLDVSIIKGLKQEEGTSIYLCGGGVFATWLLEQELIDHLKIKLNPFIQGSGVKLFDKTSKIFQLQLTNREEFDHGLQMISYDVVY